MLALSHFEAGQSRVIDEVLKGSELFDVTSASDPTTVFRLVRDGRVAASRIYPPPMTQAQAAAWLADLDPDPVLCMWAYVRRIADLVRRP
jgi:hypothetical protein